MTRALGQRLRIFETISLRVAPGLTPSLGAKHGAQRGPNVQRQTPAGNGGQPSKAVKETCFPMTVQRVVGGIEIDDDLAAILVQAAKTHQRKSSITSCSTLIYLQRLFLLFPRPR
jgi:hypothetical protein